MPLSPDDPALDYDGSWADASKDWPSIEFPSEEAARGAYVAAWREVKIPYGCSVLVGKHLRLETVEQKKAVEEHLARVRVARRPVVLQRLVDAEEEVSSYIPAGSENNLVVQPYDTFKVRRLRFEDPAPFEVVSIKVGVAEQLRKGPIKAEIFNIIDDCGIGIGLDPCLPMMLLVIRVRNTSQEAATAKIRLAGQKLVSEAAKDDRGG